MLPVVVLPRPRAKSAPVEQMTIDVHIEQTVNAEGDPERLLIATRGAMKEALERPLLVFRRHVLPEPPPTPPPVES